MISNLTAVSQLTIHAIRYDICYQLTGPETIVHKIQSRIKNRAEAAGISIETGTCLSVNYGILKPNTTHHIKKHSLVSKEFTKGVPKAPVTATIATTGLDFWFMDESVLEEKIHYVEGENCVQFENSNINENFIKDAIETKRGNEVTLIDGDCETAGYEKFISQNKQVSLWMY